MQLSNASNMRLEEAHVLLSDTPILEDGEGPRWSFKYDRFNVDPTPEILLLGAYRHPSTGNNLIGGINLHYLNNKQTKQLAGALPRIMQATNLKERYWTGRRLLPDIFNDYYRTYDAKHIRGVTKGTMYPKYGFLKSAQDWLKNKLAGIFRTKKQREKEKEKEAEPEYPDDLQRMQDRLDQVVQQLQQREEEPSKPDELEEPETPELQRAREAYRQYRRDRAEREMGLRDTEDEVWLRAHDDYIDDAQSGEDDIKDMEDMGDAEDGPDGLDITDIDDLDEALIYYSPIKGRLIIERFSLPNEIITNKRAI